jgi:hypothetical protein
LSFPRFEINGSSFSSLEAVTFLGSKMDPIGPFDKALEAALNVAKKQGHYNDYWNIFGERKENAPGEQHVPEDTLMEIGMDCFDDLEDTDDDDEQEDEEDFVGDDESEAEEVSDDEEEFAKIQQDFGQPVRPSAAARKNRQESVVSESTKKQAPTKYKEQTVARKPKPKKRAKLEPNADALTKSSNKLTIDFGFRNEVAAANKSKHDDEKKPAAKKSHLSGFVKLNIVNKKK